MLPERPYEQRNSKTDIAIISENVKIIEAVLLLMLTNVRKHNLMVILAARLRVSSDKI